jgi:hypothetical protein
LTTTLLAAIESLTIFQPRDVRGLVTVFTFAKKRELERYCHGLMIYGIDFTKVILACDDGTLLPFSHRIHWSDRVPEHLIPSGSDFETLSRNGVGPLNAKGRKVVRKTFEMFDQRRWLVGHMFYTPNLYEWHFFFFDQRDTEAVRPNHWKGGSHIHFVNWLWSNLDPRLVWSNFVEKNEPPGGALHIRYDDTPPVEVIEQGTRPRRRIMR